MINIIMVDALNPDSDDYCRTLKAQYYKNNVKNLGEWGIYGCSGAIVLVEDINGEDFRN